MAHENTISGEHLSDDTSERQLKWRLHQQWMRASRLALAAFVTLGMVTMIWLLPWVPVGMNTRSYSPEVAFSAVLLGSLAVIGVIAFSIRWSAEREADRLAANSELSRSLEDRGTVAVTGVPAPQDTDPPGVV